jgi:membrane associated rhomboid family serine protease
VLLATIGADLLHFAFQPYSKIPSIGASGGIAGLFSFYALAFPKARLGMLLRFNWVTIPAWVALILWLLYQLMYAYLQTFELVRINSLAHLGGALAGFGAWLVWRRRHPPVIN